jgi:hypothetical protein
MLPNRMQAHLQKIYDLEFNYQVEDYLITDSGQAALLEQKPVVRKVEEKLLVLEETDGMRISLYLSEPLLSFLNKNDPYVELNNENLNAFCIALEGVSHFTYLVWNASHNRPVSQLELEIQAEVDKFVTVSELIQTNKSSIQWKLIRKTLFGDCRFDSSLNDEELTRYQHANNFASNFCENLELSNTGGDRTQTVRNQLCRFYRKRHFEKLFNCNQVSAIPAP